MTPPAAKPTTPPAEEPKAEVESRPALKKVKIPPDGPGRPERIGVVTARTELPEGGGVVLDVRVTEPGVLAGNKVRVQESFVEYV